MKLDRINSNPARMNGQPCIRNLRLTVRRVIELLVPFGVSKVPILNLIMSVKFESKKRVRYLSRAVLATYSNKEELLQEFPELEEEDIQQALIYASTYLDDRIIDISSHDATVA